MKKVNFTETVMYCGFPHAVPTIHKVTGLRENKTKEKTTERCTNKISILLNSSFNQEAVNLLLS